MGWQSKWTVFVVCVVSGAGLASAQDAYLAQYYGEGVHAYFRHDTSASKNHFDTAVNHGSRDPRVYYFRAIIAIQEGASGTAQSDVQQGARYELEGRGSYDVWRALDRVQGSHRIEFENMRREALLVLRKKSVTDRHSGSSDLPFLRQPSDPSRTPLDPNLPSMPHANSDDPFHDEPPEAPEQFSLEDDDLGLDDTAEPDPAAEVEDPFEADDMAPMDEPAEEAPMADDEAGDPFADDAPAEDFAPADDGGDPFAEDLPAGDAAEAVEDIGEAAAEGDPLADDAAGDGDLFESIFE